MVKPWTNIRSKNGRFTRYPSPVVWGASRPLFGWELSDSCGGDTAYLEGLCLLYGGYEKVYLSKLWGEDACYPIVTGFTEPGSGGATGSRGVGYARFYLNDRRLNLINRVYHRRFELNHGSFFSVTFLSHQQKQKEKDEIKKRGTFLMYWSWQRLSRYLMHAINRLEYERLSQQLEEMIDGGRCSSELLQYIRIIGKLISVQDCFICSI